MTQAAQFFQRAQHHAARREWGQAGASFADAGTAALAEGERAMARSCFEAAGESWRRDDRPAAAARALQAALDLTEGESTVLALVRLAGVLGDLGRAAESEALCQRAAAMSTDGPLRWMVLDTLISTFQARGRKEDARPLVAALESATGGPQEVAAGFRRGQLHRLDGELAEAASCFIVVAGQLEDVDGAEAGLAAAQAELAEVALLRGDSKDAVDLYQVAWECHSHAGRRALAWRAEAGRARAGLAHGVRPLTRGISQGIGHAEERDMPLLEADLRLVRAMAHAEDQGDGAERDFDRAMQLARACGDPLRTGRVLLERSTRLALDPEDAVKSLEEAIELLRPNRPWWSRARLALGLGRLAAGHPDGRGELAAAMAQFEDMGMARDAAAARRWLQRIG